MARLKYKSRLSSRFFKTLQLKRNVQPKCNIISSSPMLSQDFEYDPPSTPGKNLQLCIRDHSTIHLRSKSVQTDNVCMRDSSVQCNDNIFSAKVEQKPSPRSIVNQTISANTIQLSSEFAHFNLSQIIDDLASDSNDSSEEGLGPRDEFLPCHIGNPDDLFTHLSIYGFYR